MYSAGNLFSFTIQSWSKGTFFVFNAIHCQHLISILHPLVETKASMCDSYYDSQVLHVILDVTVFVSTSGPV